MKIHGKVTAKVVHSHHKVDLHEGTNATLDKRDIEWALAHPRQFASYLRGRLVDHAKSTR